MHALFLISNSDRSEVYPPKVLVGYASLFIYGVAIFWCIGMAIRGARSGGDGWSLDNDKP